MTNEVRKLIKHMIPASIRASIKSSQLARAADHMMRAHDSIYDREYYDRDVEPGAIQSAGVMAKSIVERFQPKTVIDVGCGTGALLEAFHNLNCQVCGLEYSEAGLASCRGRKLHVRKFNIATDHIDAEQYDVAVSFEVAEHLPSRIADRFVGLLCDLSPLAVVSAATPGQGGTDHVNEQPHSYWIEKFQRRGYKWDRYDSDRLSFDWRSAGTAPWYHNNVLVFVRGGRIAHDE
jgi:SAM-dependent methyltransferase